MTRADDASLRRRGCLAPESQSQTGRFPRLVSLDPIVLIIASVAAVVLDSVVGVRAEYGSAPGLFEAACIGVFTLE